MREGRLSQNFYTSKSQIYAPISNLKYNNKRTLRSPSRHDNTLNKTVFVRLYKKVGKKHRKNGKVGGWKIYKTVVRNRNKNGKVGIQSVVEKYNKRERSGYKAIMKKHCKNLKVKAWRIYLLYKTVANDRNKNRKVEIQNRRNINIKVGT